MLNNSDRFSHFDIKLGDTARFPLALQEFGRADGKVYNRTWEVIAFGGDGRRHLVQVRRRHDGLTKWISNHWFDAYANGYLKGGRYAPAPKRARRSIYPLVSRCEMIDGCPVFTVKTGTY